VGRPSKSRRFSITRSGIRRSRGIARVEWWPRSSGARASCSRGSGSW
jgi:hypothetical protein